MLGALPLADLELAAGNTGLVIKIGLHGFNIADRGLIAYGGFNEKGFVAYDTTTSHVVLSDRGMIGVEIDPPILLGIALQPHRMPLGV